MTNLTTATGLKAINTGWFNDLLANWLPAVCGPKPTHEMLAIPLALGKRPGVEALHIAMCLRPAGCTVRQFQVAGSCGPANNYRRSLVNAKLITVNVTGKPYAFVAALTAAGKAAVAKGEQAAIAASAVTGKPKAEKAAKPPPAQKAASKPRKPKAAPVPVTDAAPLPAAIGEPAMQPPMAG